MQAFGARIAIQLRAPMLPAKIVYDVAEALARFQSDTGSWLIVNDRVDIALAVGAKGIQLTSKSMTVEDARIAAPGATIGASVHSVEEAIQAQKAGAAWCVAGNVFATATHPGRPGRRIEFIHEIAKAVSIPVIAIGGVKPRDVGLLLEAGAYGIATIRGAGWSESADTRYDEPLATVLGAQRESGPVIPLSHYIWEYDAYRGDERRDHAHG